MSFPDHYPTIPHLESPVSVTYKMFLEPVQYLTICIKNIERPMFFSHFSILRKQDVMLGLFQNYKNVKCSFPLYFCQLAYLKGKFKTSRKCLIFILTSVKQREGDFNTELICFEEQFDNLTE